MLQNVYIAWPLTSIKSLYLLQKYWVFCDFFSSHAYKLGYGFKSTEFNYIKKKKKTEVHVQFIHSNKTYCYSRDMYNE